MTDGELWSWVRSVMAQGACIQQDYASGLAHKTYEAYSARLDTAAAERADELAARLVMIPRGHLKLPESQQEAEAMARVAALWLASHETPNVRAKRRPTALRFGPVQENVLCTLYGAKTQCRWASA